MELHAIPSEVIEHIKDYLWGNLTSQQHQLNIVEKLDTYPQHSLHVNSICYFNGILKEIEDEIYCPYCGEKTMFPFTLERCYDCQEL